jgi:hypothetical protein
MDLSAFDDIQQPYPTKVSPEVQAERNRLANDLRKAEGLDTTIEQDMEIFKRMQQKSPYKPVTEAERNQVLHGLAGTPQPSNLNLGAFDKINLNAFDKLASKEDSSWYDYPLDVGRFAAKGLMGLGGAIAGGAGAIIEGVRGGDPVNAAQKIMEDATSPEEIQSKTVVGKTLDHVFEKAMEIAKEWGSEGVEEYFNTLGLDKDNRMRAVGYAAAQSLPDIAMTILGIKSLTPKGKKPTATLDIPTEPPPPSFEPQVIRRRTPQDKGVIPYEQVNLMDVIQEQQRPERPVNVETFPYDKINESMQGEAATSLSARSAGVDRPLDLGIPEESVTLQTLPREGELYNKYAKKQTPTLEERATQQPLDFSLDKVVDDAVAAMQKPGFLQDAVDKLTIKEGEKVAPNIFKGPGRKQAGAVDWSTFIVAPEFRERVVKAIVGFNFLKKNWPLFADSTEIKMLTHEGMIKQIDKTIRNGGFPMDNHLELLKEGLPGFYSPADSKIYINLEHPTYNGLTTKQVASIFGHELVHGIQDIRNRWDTKKWLTDEHMSKPWEERPWEIEAMKAEQTIVNRDLTLKKRGQSGQGEIFNDFAKWLLDPDTLKLPFSTAARAYKKIIDPNNKDPKLQKFIFGKAENTSDLISRLEPTVIAGLMDDVKAEIGFQTVSHRSMNDLIKNPDSPAQQVKMHVDNKLQEAAVMEHVFAHQWQYTFRDLYRQFDLAGPLHRTKTALFNKIPEIKNDVGILLDVEKNPAAWRQAGEWYPTKDQLVQMGIPEKRAVIWRKVYDIHEQLWGIMEQTLKMNHMPVPERIPGWVSHIFRGPYSVAVERILNKGTPEEKAVKVYEFNYPNKGRLDKAIVELNDIVKNNYAGQDIVVRAQKPLSEGNLVQELLNGMWQAKDKTSGSAQKGLQKLLEKIYESASKGIITSALDRGTPPVKGHLLERINMNGPLGLTNKEIREAVRSFEKVAESVTGWYVRSKLVNEVLFPLDASGLLPPGSNLRTNVRTYMENFFKIPDVMLKELDTKITDMLINRGMSPDMASNIAQALNSGMAKFYLFGNSSFYLANSGQWTMSVPNLLAIKAIGQLAGEKTGSVTKAIRDGTGDLGKAITLKERHELVKYATEHGHIDPVAIENIDPYKFRDPIAIETERRTRQAAFNFGYAYFKQIMSKEEAMAAAGKFTDMVAVPYNRAFGSPSIVAKLPVVGNVLSVFMTYQQHMLGVLDMQLKLLGRSMKEGDVKAAGSTLGSMASMQAINFALFGIGGISLMNNWDSIIKGINALVGEDFYTSKELGRLIDQWAEDKGVNTGGFATYGGASKLLGMGTGSAGYDISASGSGVGLMLPEVAFSALSLALSSATLGVRQAMGTPITQKDKWEVVRTMPKMYQTFFEYGMKNDHLQDIVDQVIGKKPDYSLPRDPNMKGFKRNQKSGLLKEWTGLEEDTFMKLTTFLRSLEEQDYNITNQLDRMKNQNIQKEAQRNLQILKEATGKWGEKEQRAVDFLTKEALMHPLEVANAIADYRKEGQLSVEEKKALGVNTLQGIRKYQQHQQLQQMEGTR